MIFMAIPKLATTTIWLLWYLSPCKATHPPCKLSDLSTVEGSRAESSVVAVFDWMHDWNVAMALGGQVLGVFDVSLSLGIPHFGSVVVPRQDRLRVLKRLREMIWPVAQAQNLSLRAPLDIAIWMEGFMSQTSVIRSAPRLFHHKCQLGVHHHYAHALYGFYDSPFTTTALILSLDGGGSDGTYNLWWGDKGITRADELANSKHNRQAVTFIKRQPYNLAHAYLAIAQHLPHVQLSNNHWHLSTALMDYATQGTPRDVWRAQLQRLFRDPDPLKPDKKILLSNVTLQTKQDAEDFAATAQETLSNVVLEDIRALFEMPHYASAGGVVLVGGVAYNALLVSTIARNVGPHRPVYVPCAPGDEGISVGMLYHVQPPLKVSPHALRYVGNPYVGMKCLNHSHNKEDVLHCSALRTSTKYQSHAASCVLVGRLLTSGARVGVIQGRSALGTNTFGVRSILVGPQASRELQRAFLAPFQPVNLVVAAEAQGQITNEHFTTGCVSYAPLLKDEIRSMYPAFADGHGNGRVFLISKETNKWLHTLLIQMQMQLHIPVAAEVPFFTDVGRSKVKVLINDIGVALHSLERGKIDALVVDDMVFWLKTSIFANVTIGI